MAISPINSVGGYSTGITMTSVIDAVGNITGVTGSFTRTLTGTTANFTGLVSSTVGFSGPGTNLKGVVTQVNGLSGGVTLAAGTNITLTPVGNTITIASSGGGGGSSVYTVNDTLDFSEIINGIEFVIYGTGTSLATSLKYIENYSTIVVKIETFEPVYTTVLQSIKSFYDATNGWSARLILKPPFEDVLFGPSNFFETAENVIASGFVSLQLALTSTTGATLSDQWTSALTPTLYHQEETYVTKTLTGITWVTDSMFLNCKVLGLTSADHTPEDAILEGVNFEINNIVGGTGFDIIGHAPEGTYGKYTIKCLGQ